MAFVIDDDELAVGPALVEFPCGFQGGTDIPPAVNQDARDVGNAVYMIQDRTFTQKGRVSPVVDDQRREGRLEVQIPGAEI